jgi:hypothetical protein
MEYNSVFVVIGFVRQRASTVLGEIFSGKISDLVLILVSVVKRRARCRLRGQGFGLFKRIAKR